MYSLVAVISHAGGIKGRISTAEGTPLAYATIFIKQTGSGGVTGPDGHYEIVLAPGNYDVTYQYLGYETITRQVEVNES